MDAPDAWAQHYSEQHLELENASVHPTHRGRFGWLGVVTVLLSRYAGPNEIGLSISPLPASATTINMG